MRELEGAPLDVAAAATGAAVALGVVGGVTAALTRRRPASSAREGDGVKGESSRGLSRAKTANELSTAAASASIARAPFLVLLAIAAVLLAAEHARRGWGAPLDPLDVRGALSAIERLAPPASRADVRPECARVSARGAGAEESSPVRRVSRRVARTSVAHLVSEATTGGRCQSLDAARLAAFLAAFEPRDRPTFVLPAFRV